MFLLPLVEWKAKMLARLLLSYRLKGFDIAVVVTKPALEIEEIFWGLRFRLSVKFANPVLLDLTLKV